jgi:YVTN family beta-propeller protein
MIRLSSRIALGAALALTIVGSRIALAGQVPGAATASDTPVSAHDRVYLSDQTSNTISVVDPSTNLLLGAIPLGANLPGNLSPLYKGQLLVHGMGFSPDHRTLDVVAVGSNAVTFIDTQTNTVKATTYVGRSPHEAFFTADGKEVWVTVRGENYLSVLSGTTYKETSRIPVPDGPGMTIFSADGRLGFVCSSFTPETVAIDRATHRIVGRIAQPSPFCPDLAATPDGTQVWETLKDIGRVLVFSAKAPFERIAVLETGPITNHVNIVHNAKGQFAYVTVGGLNAVKVFTTDAAPKLVATIPTGALPHGLWPSGDGSRIYVGLENADAVAAIDTLTNTVIATIPSGQSPQGMVYVPNAVTSGDGRANLVPLGDAGKAVHLQLGDVGGSVRSTATVNSQGLIDLLEVAVTGLAPKTPYVLALAANADGSGALQALATFMTNPAGAQIVTALGPLRAIVGAGTSADTRRYLVVAASVSGKPGTVIQVERDPSSPAS